MTAAFTVVRGLPPTWDDLVAQAPVSVSRRWMALGMNRMGPEYRIFTVEDESGARAAIGGLPLTAGHRSPRIDPYQILSGRSAGLGLIPDGPHPWAGLAPEQVFPTLLLMYPNYDMYPIGSGAEDPGLTDRLALAVRDWCRTEGIASIAVLYAGDRAAPFLARLRALGAAVVPLTGACVLDVRWDDLDGYIRTLPSKWRGSVRKELDRLAADGVALAEEDFDGITPEWLDLRGQLVAKYGGGPSRDKDIAAIEELRRHFAPDEISVWTARHAGRLVSYTVLLKDASTWTAFLTGSDYSDPHSRYGYFATAFYQPAAVAAARGIERIVYGLGSWEAKRLRGCRVEPLTAASLLLADTDYGGRR